MLEAATAVFLETSPMLASLDTIAARAGVARLTLLFHFGSRAELMDQVGQYHLERYRAAACEFEPGELRPFLEAYLGAQRSRQVRLVWQLGDLLYPDHPEGPNAGYWDLVAEIERRLVDGAQLDPGQARTRARVLAPALMMVVRRAAQDLATEREMRDFAAAACELAQAPSTGEVDD
ncbi:MAG TPA: TetR/AcrR family transcriptional regulator [Acidimicrobiales bacterium]|nr:TetR/AcrR family transcriptional regulator [Acidimicrobiales bacterium]